MASEDVKARESAVSKIVNFAEEAKLAKEEIKPSKYQVYSICKSLVAGGVAGGVSRTAVAPLERLKILLQVQNPHNIKYNGTVQGLKYIWRTEGLRGLFKGNGTNCARIVPNSAVKFFSYEQASKGCTADSFITSGTGACAGIIAMSATYPMDMVRGRLTVQTDKSPISTEECFMLYQLCFVRKVSAHCTRVGCHPSLESFIFALKKILLMLLEAKIFIMRTRDEIMLLLSIVLCGDWLIKSKPFGLVEDNDLGVVTRLACGAAAGTVGQTVAYPLDVIRRRMQMVGWNNASSIVTGDGRSKAPLEYTGMIDAFRKTVRHEGFRALYKGLVPNSVKVVPSIAIAFVTYEQVKELLGVEIRYQTDADRAVIFHSFSVIFVNKKRRRD
ncbi:UNVERIFIED_CONTAM: Mitochondrial adenine nucleotide transporter ADNT1 [Sesamum angustifolium]|uniref:Mitochondrial adenine nucleotide transporter ADNT1 n=1 Tax=Sesamum angustifolium TaxID=2727405 RepID=A0AAW2RHB5_9LAMI